MGPFRSLDPPESLTYRQANNFPPDIKFCTGDPSQRTIPESSNKPGKIWSVWIIALIAYCS